MSRRDAREADAIRWVNRATGWHRFARTLDGMELRAHASAHPHAATFARFFAACADDARAEAEASETMARHCLQSAEEAP